MFSIHYQSLINSNAITIGNYTMLLIFFNRYAARNMLGNLKVNDIVQNIQARKGESLYVQAKFVLDTLNNFMASDHPCITTAHVPDQRTEVDGKQHVIDHDTKMVSSRYCIEVWDTIVIFDSRNIHLIQYMRLFALQCSCNGDLLT